MERSSSTTSRWAMGSIPSLPKTMFSSRLEALASRGHSGTEGARQFDYKFGAVSLLGLDANASLMRLKDLVNNCEA